MLFASEPLFLYGGFDLTTLQQTYRTVVVVAGRDLSGKLSARGAELSTEIESTAG